MDIRKIRKLIELINETGIGEIEVTTGDDSVRISRAAPTSQPGPITQPAYTAIPHAATEKNQPEDTSSHQKNKHETQPEGHRVKSPMVGTVYLAPTPGAKPFVSVGQHVAAGDTLCLIEAMKMYNKIEADASGIISARLIDNEQPVEYDQPLFIIDTNE